MQPITIASPSRLSAFDNLRASAAFLGIVIHTIYFLLVNNNHDQQLIPPLSINGALLTFFYLHMFRLGVFFVVAGFFAHLLQQKLGSVRFIKHRFMRIGIPFITLILLQASVPLLLTFSYAKMYGDQQLPAALGIVNNTSWLHLGWALLQNTTYLWFLYDLLIFYAVTVISLTIMSMIKRLYTNLSATKKYNPSSTYSPATTQIQNFSTSIFSLKGLILLAAILIFCIMTTHAWYPPTDMTLTPDITLLIYHGTFFFIGWQLWNNPIAFQILQKHAWLLFSIGTLVCFPIFYISAHCVALSHGQFTLALQHLGCANYATGALFTTLGILGLACRYFTSRHSLFRYGSDAAYWIFLMQIPILSFLLPSHATNLSFMNISILVVECTLLCLMSYHLIVRYTFIGYILNGIKRERPKLFGLLGFERK